ncbi:MAG: BrnT family toxin, partial [Candidatus Thorarchaeota archaeon]|nr:BrnT family toxin [Candidatus Thorarchaeota archaeon]
MQIERLYWREEVIEKLLTKHGVTRDEVEEVVNGRNEVRKCGKDRYLLFGQTDAGRYLLVVLVKDKDECSLYIPISARE